MAAPISSGLFLLGGAASAAFAVVKHSSGKKRGESRPSSEVVCPATPSTPYPRSAASWLRVAGSSSPSKMSACSTEAPRSPAVTSISVPQEGLSMRVLEAGSLVCFYTSLGELVTVKKEHKNWDLHACLAPSPPNAEGSFRLPYFPAEAVFAVTRNGSKIGFRSLGADGRSLQAVKAPDAPHRVANHNFGSWESWEVTSSGLVNVQWRHKVLGLEIREVRVVAREDIRKTERQQMHASRNSRTQVKSLDRQLSDTERRLQEMVAASQRQASLAQNEIEKLQQQLSQAVGARRSAEADAMRRGATLKQLEHRLGELSSEKDSADDACEHVGSRVHDLETEVRDLRSRHAEQIARLQHQQARDSSAAQGAGMSTLQLQLAESERRWAQARSELAKVQTQADADKDGLQAEMRRALQAKDAEIEGLLADRVRLDAALSSIKGQITSAASPARPGASLMQSQPLVQPSLDSHTLRGLRKALEEANPNSANASPVTRPCHNLSSCPKQSPSHLGPAAPAVAGSPPDVENQQPESSQASPPASTSPDAPGPTSGGPGHQTLVPHSAPPAQRSNMWLAPPPPVRTPSGLYAMLNPGATGQPGALYDLLKSADNSPRSSYATPRILTPSCTPTVAEARISDTVIWKDSMDSTADSHTMARLPSLPSSHASVDMTQSYRHRGGRRGVHGCVDSTDRMSMQPTIHRVAGSTSVAGSWAMPPGVTEEQSRGGTDVTRLVQHFGPDAEDVEHMSERYIDDQMPGAVQVPRPEDPRPRFAEFALLEQPSCESLDQEPSPGPSQVEIVVQGHEEFDDEITLAGSGRVTPSGELLRCLSESVSPGDTATGPVNADEPLAEVLQQDPPDQNEGSDRWARGSVSACFDGGKEDGNPQQNDDGASSLQPGACLVMSHDGVAEQIQQHAEQPLPSLTPYCKTGNRAVALRNSWSHPLSPSNSLGSDEYTGSKKRSSFLGRPLKELEDLW